MFSWTKIYNKIAYKLLEYKDKSDELANIMYKSLEEAGLMFSEEKGANLDFDGDKRCRYKEIDPISFMNRFEMYSDDNRRKFIEAAERNLGMEIEIPDDFDGLPSTNPQMSVVVRFAEKREKEDIPNIWKLFELALNMDFNNNEDRNKFIEIYDKVISKPVAKFNISVGLFKIRPDIFLNLDYTNREYLVKIFNINIKDRIFGKEYLELIDEVIMKLGEETLIEFSYKAWKDKSNNKINEINAHEKERKNIHYWLYSPGENARFWNECLEKGIMVLGFDEIGDLNQYNDVDEMFDKIKNVYHKDNPYNDKCALDDFKNKIEIGDIIIAKKGAHTIIGYGEVTSDYYFDDSRREYKHVRKIEWKKDGKWYHKDKIVLKTLTDITKYDNYPYEIMDIINGIDNMDETKQYFWLNANPKIWSFSDLKNGEIIEYTAINDNGHKRRIYKNYLNAKKGDLVIAYESTPIKSIVGICVVEEGLKDNILKIKKLETLINPIPYNEILSEKDLENMEYMKNPQGSLFVLNEIEFNVIMDMIRDLNPLVKKEFDSYSKEDFLNDVYISDIEYDRLSKLLLKKKNIILQGAPGVGKTFMAKRLAYSIIGKKDDEKIKTIQFHQNYSYEDFIEGYRPTENGYELEKGIFYNFCKKAENDPNEPYFFIIDEINRGNLSKIFGELMMLIESDKRGNKLTLAYSKIGFSVPENLYIIGMMNTADRSLALMDYALRRRFAFYKVKPAFESNMFKEYQNKLSSEKFNKLIRCVESINKDIDNDLSLGEGFEIGHSYFCNMEKVIDEDIKLIVDYEILPLLEEYWFDDIDKFNECKDKLNGVING